MSGNRFKLRCLRRRGGTPTPTPTPGSMIAPGPLWSGSDGSGWSGDEPTPTAMRAVTDPARPIGGPFGNYQGEAFNSDFPIYIEAFCGGGGVAGVQILMEGNTALVVDGSFERIVGYDGVERTAWLYKFVASHAAFSQDGWVRFYIELIPADAGKDVRILGPYWIKRKTGPIFDATLTFGAGGTYTDLRAANAAAKSETYVGSEHIRLKPMTSHRYDFSGTWNMGTLTKKGQIVLLPDEGDTITIGRASYPLASIRMYSEGMVFGKGVVFDMGHVSVIQSEEGSGHRPYVFAGARITSSVGVNDLQGALKSPRKLAITATTDFPLFLECTVDNFDYGPGQARINRWCNISGGTNDIISLSLQGPRQYSIQHGLHIGSWSSLELRTPLDSFEIQYTGPGAAASYLIDGPMNASGRKITLTVDGAPTVISASVDEAGFTGNYTMENLVAAINAVSGWTATLLNNDRRAAAMGSINATVSVGNAKIKTVVTAAFDIHADLYQTPTGTFSTENTLICNTTGVEQDGTQIWFLAAQGVGSNIRDTLILNTGMDVTGAYGQLSQFQGSHSHVLFWHNTLCGQNLGLQFDKVFTPDAGCEIYGSVLPTLSKGGTMSNDLLVQNNRWWVGPDPGGARSIDNNIAGAMATDIPEHATGDFTPAATLLSDLVPRRVAFDMLGNPRNAMTAKGAVEVPS